MENRKLADIVESLLSEDISNKPIKRAITKAAKGFRPKSSNDVEHYTFLATCLYSIGHGKHAKEILQALDAEAERIEDRCDLGEELSGALVFLAHVYGLENQDARRIELTQREEIRSRKISGNTWAGDFDNRLQWDLNQNRFALKELRLDKTMAPREKLQLAYRCYTSMVMYSERLDEIRGEVSDEDVAALSEALTTARDKFIEILTA